MPRTKYMKVKEANACGLTNLPNFSATGSIIGMKRMYYGLNALLVRSGKYIYNATGRPDLYEKAK